MSGRAAAMNPALSDGWKDFDTVIWLPRDAEGFLERLQAPDDGSRRLPWWWRELALALLAGAVLGVVAFSATGANSPETIQPTESSAVASNAAPSSAASAVAVQPAAEQTEDVVDTSSNMLAGLQKEPAATGEQSTAPAAIDEQRVRRRLRLLARRSRLGRYRGPYRQLLQRGWRHLAAGEYAPASVAFGRAVHLHPDRAAAYYGLALALFEQGQEDAVLNLLEQAQKKLGPQNDIWVLAGSAYQFLGREKLARTMYRRYLEHNPRGRYARDLKVILSYPRLPTLLPD